MFQSNPHQQQTNTQFL